MLACGEDVTSPDALSHSFFASNFVTESARTVGEAFDDLLSSLGYKREGALYRVTKENDSTVLIAAHASSSSAVLSHIFNLPLPFVFCCLRPEFTAITVVSLSSAEGSTVAPRFEIALDDRHIHGLEDKKT